MGPPPGNVISAELVDRVRRSKSPSNSVPFLTILYGKVIATKSERLWIDGFGVNAMLAGLSELYSPSMDQVICANGFLLPVTNPTQIPGAQISRGAIIKFTAAIYGIYGLKPKVLVAKNIELVRGAEKTIYLAATSYTDDQVLPELTWYKPFLFESQIQKFLDYEIRVQEQQEQQLAKQKQEARRTTFSVKPDENVSLTKDVITPGLDKELFVHRNGVRPKLHGPKEEA